MPRAGSTVPSTISCGTLTTKINRPVRVSTLTKMLNARPKNAFVSPRVHHGTRKATSSVVLVFRVGSLMLIVNSPRESGGGGRQRGQPVQQRGRVGDPAEDAAL